jgi:hypothetical protein
MSYITATGGIRQNYKNSYLNTAGLNIGFILHDKKVNTGFYYALLGSGTAANRIYNFYKRHPTPNNATNIFFM